MLQNRTQIKPDIPAIIKMMACVLSETVRTQDKLLDDYQLSVFHQDAVPRVKLYQYFVALFLQFRCSLSSFMIIFVYINRILEKNDLILLCSFTIHRLILTCLVVSAKFNDELSFKNRDYAQIGGISPEELKVLERELLYLIDYELLVTPQTFKLAHSEIKSLYKQSKYIRSSRQNYQSMHILTTHKSPLRSNHRSIRHQDESPAHELPAPLSNVSRSESIASLATTAALTHSNSYQELPVTDTNHANVNHVRNSPSINDQFSKRNIQRLDSFFDCEETEYFRLVKENYDVSQTLSIKPKMVLIQSPIDSRSSNQEQKSTVQIAQLNCQLNSNNNVVRIENRHCRKAQESIFIRIQLFIKTILAVFAEYLSNVAFNLLNIYIVRMA